MEYPQPPRREAAEKVRQAMGTGKSPPGLELWLPADTKAVPQARRDAMTACLGAGLTDDECFMLDLALGEALANAVLHGASALSAVNEPDRHVHVSVWNYQDQLIIQVQDRGPGFDPPLPPYPMLQAVREETHGRGLPLMETLTDAMIVCRGDADEGGASVFLVKKFER